MKLVDVLIRIAALFSKRPGFFFSGLVLVCILLGYVASRIAFKEDISSFMPKSEETRIIDLVYTHSKISDKIIFKISFKDTLTADAEALKMHVDDFVENLTDNLSDYATEITYRVDNNDIAEVQNEILENIPYYLTTKDYTRMDSIACSDSISLIMNLNKQMLLMPTIGFMKSNILTDPLHFSSNILRNLAKFDELGSFQLDDGYFFSKDGKNILLFVTAKNNMTETKENAVLVEKIEKSIAQLNSISEGTLHITYFGAVPVSVSNAQQIKKDSIISMIIALALIVIVLSLYFRRISSLLLIIVPIFFGALLSLALIVLFQGTLSSIAIGAGSSIFGIAVNYSLHFLVHYRHEQNVESTLRDIAFPMTVGSITTVGAFLSLLFVKSDALQDFGLFSALTLLGTLLFVLLCLPVFLRKGKNTTSQYGSKRDKKTVWEKIAESKMENIPYIGLILTILTVIFACFSTSVKFETDFSKLGYMTQAQQKAQAEINAIAHTDIPYLYYVCYGNNIEEALECYEKSKPILDSLAKLDYFIQIRGIGDFLPSRQTQIQRVEQWEQFWADKKSAIIQNFEKGCHHFGLNNESFQGFYNLLRKDYAKEVPDFSVMQKQLLNDYLIETPECCAVISLLYPKESVDIEAFLKKSPLAGIEHTVMFNRALSNENMIHLLYHDFNWVLWICAFLVTAFLIVSFGRIELTVLAILPMVFGWFWILGIMALFDIQFNIINIILATFIFGLGDDYSIFMLEGLIQDYARKKRLLISYKVAVTLSAVTLFIGIGTLIISQHPAMRSLAQVSMIGMASVVLMTYAISPLIFKKLTQKKGKPRLQPVTGLNLIKTIYSFSVFVLGCIVFNLLLPFFLIPFANMDKRKYWYHCVFSWGSRFVTPRIPSVKYHLLGYDSRKFEKPAIIISNHQAHIDLTCIIGLSPKMIVLTNKWVWNTPFYALPMRFADFYPIANNFENSFDKLEKVVRKGYSILIFPEGTRSEDCSIKRFHKGAFYLAEQLKIDILPITIHGFGHVLPKKELMIRKGKITVKVGERVPFEAYSQLGGYQQTSKWFRQQIQTSYDELSAEIETADYWADKVLHNYIYKGVEIEWSVRKNLRKQANYKKWIQSISSAKNVQVLNCGYGEFPLLAAMVLKNTNIYAFENDENKYSIAENCTNIPQNLHYVKNDEITPIKYDCVLDMNKLLKYGD